MSGYQKIVRIIGVLYIIAGIILTVSGMVAAAVCSAAGSPDIASHLEGYSEDTSLSLFGAFGASALAGIIDIITGVLGVRAANDDGSIDPLCAASIISLVSGLGYLIYCAAGSGVSALLFAGPVLSVILVFCAFRIKKQKAAEGPKRESDARLR